jgi:hypothetical protein
MKKYTIWIVIVLILGGLIWWSGAAKSKKEGALEAMSSREIALRQTTDMATQYHIHPEIAIIVNGTPVAIPHNLGVAPTPPQSIAIPQPLPQKTTQPTYKPSTPTASVVSSPTATYQTTPPATTPIAQTTETEAVATPAAASVSLEALRDQWKQIIEWVGKKSHSLTFILNTAHLAQLNGERLTIVVPYDFHREKLSEAKNKKLLEQGISEVAHTTVYITCETNAATPKKPTNEENANLDSLAASFGGEVVSS